MEGIFLSPQIKRERRLENLEIQAKKERFSHAELIQLVQIVRQMNMNDQEPETIMNPSLSKETSIEQSEFEEIMHEIMDHAEAVIPLMDDYQASAMIRLGEAFIEKARYRKNQLREG